MKLEDSKAFTEKCFNGDPASCSHGCPFHMDVRTFLDRCARGKWVTAYKVLRDELVFPVIVSRLCDAPCKARCQRLALGDEALDLPALERACLRYTKKRAVEHYAIAPRSERLAVVGAGVAGLSLALIMAQKKYQVTVFDAREGWGGRLRERADFDAFDEDLRLQFSAVEVDFRFETRISSLDELAEYDAVYLATGREGESFGLLGSYQPELHTTAREKVFLGGELVGKTLMEGIAQGPELSRTMEYFLQTGRAALAMGGYEGESCERYPVVGRAEKKPWTPPTDPENGYSEAEAMAEAGRCMQCDCDECMSCCEMLRRYRKKPEKLAVEVYTDSQASPPIATHALTRQAYSCNQCGYCKSVCPEGVDLGGLFHMSLVERVRKGDDPTALHDFWLRELEFTQKELFFAAPPAGQTSCRYVFFPGCRLGATMPETLLAAYDRLAAHYDLGVILGCCGAPAYWAGDEARLHEVTARLRESWEALGKPIFVFACMSCARMLEQALPEIARVSAYELLAALEPEGTAAAGEKMAVFDPCSARGCEKVEQSVRELVHRAGVETGELAEKNRCCGYGGHIQVANPALYEEITRNRAELSELPYVVYCANCREVFALRGKRAVHALDLALGRDGAVPPLSLKQKKENGIMVKVKLAKALRGETFTPTAHPWDGLKLTIPDTVRAEMEARLISEDDVREAIYTAEQAGDYFVDDGDGVRLCSLIREIMIYWVQYRAEDGGYAVESAYYHRMHFDEGETK